MLGEEALLLILNAGPNTQWNEEHTGRRDRVRRRESNSVLVSPPFPGVLGSTRL